MFRIDLNCDLGEGATHDDELLGIVTSANVACGAHAGDDATMRRTVMTAQANGVSIGAHPGFVDREGFGRRHMSLPSQEVFDLVVDQIDTLRAIADAVGARVRHVKPHGALYNMAATDGVLAAAIARAVASCDAELVLFGLAGSELVGAGQHAGLRTAAEGFADRGYEADGTLMPRGQPGAVIHDTSHAVEQAIALATRKSVTTRGGDAIAVVCDTICIHGDTPGAPEVARAIREALEATGVDVRPVSS